MLQPGAGNRSMPVSQVPAHVVGPARSQASRLPVGYMQPTLPTHNPKDLTFLMSVPVSTGAGRKGHKRCT